MRENRLSGSEGGGVVKAALPTPISKGQRPLQSSQSDDEMRLIMMNAPSAHSSKVFKGREPFDGFSKGKALGKARQRLS